MAMFGIFGIGIQELIILGLCAAVPLIIGVVVALAVMLSQSKRD